MLLGLKVMYQCNQTAYWSMRRNVLLSSRQLNEKIGLRDRDARQYVGGLH